MIFVMQPSSIFLSKIRWKTLILIIDISFVHIIFVKKVITVKSNFSPIKHLNPLIKIDYIKLKVLRKNLGFRTIKHCKKIKIQWKMNKVPICVDYIKSNKK